MRRGILFLLAATLAVTAVFTLWPALDLETSDRFHDAATGTWLAEAPVLEAVRNTIWTTGQVSIGVFILLFLLALARRGRAQVPARLWGFAVSAFTLGPGLLVNLGLKDHWGRARPRTVTEFGGESTFTPALQLADQCARNCSFVSGEVAMASTLALLLWLFAAPRLVQPARVVLGTVLLGLTGLTAYLRVAAGGHFLSDVLLAALLPAFLTLALWRLTGAAAVAPRLTARALADDLAAPFAFLWRRN